MEVFMVVGKGGNVNGSEQRGRVKDGKREKG